MSGASRVTTAVLADRFGGPERARPVQVPLEPPGPGQILIRYEVSGVNPIDWKIVRGDLAGVLGGPPARLGVEAAGVVTRTGPGVTRFAVGDRVIRHGAPGTFSREEVVPADVDADMVTPMPEGYSFAQAAVLPVGAGTALSAMRAVGLTAPDRLLVIGASGGVGEAVVRLARRAGVRDVTAVAPARHLSWLATDLGVATIPAEDGDRRAEVAAADPYDVVIDCYGQDGDPVGEGRRAVPSGRAVSILDRPGGFPLVRHIPRELPTLLRLLGERPLHLPIRRAYPLVDAAAALRDVINGGHRGHVVLTCRPQVQPPPPGEKRP